MTAFPIVHLNEIASIDRDSVQPDSLPLDTEYIGLEHIAKGGTIRTRSTIGSAQLQSSKFRYSRYHLLYGKLRPNLAKISYPESDGVCSTDIIPILPSQQIIGRYLLHYLRTPAMVDLAISLATGANLPRLSPKDLAKLKVPLPPMYEQRRITATLDQVDALREQRRKAIALLDELAQSIFNGMFGSYLDFKAAERSCLKLSDLADVSSGITKGRKIPPGPLQDYPYLAVANVQDRYLNLTSVKSISVSTAEIERYSLSAGDLLLTEGGDPDKLGRGVVWSGEISQCLHQNHIFRVRVFAKDKISPIYLNWLTASPYGKRYFLRTAKQTTGIASINKRQLSSFPILLPPRDLQSDFERQLRAIEQQKQAAQAHLAELDALFASLQWRAFRGELWETSSD